MVITFILTLVMISPIVTHLLDVDLVESRYGHAVVFLAGGNLLVSLLLVIANGAHFDIPKVNGIIIFDLLFFLCWGLQILVICITDRHGGDYLYATLQTVVCITAVCAGHFAGDYWTLFR